MQVLTLVIFPKNYDILSLMESAENLKYHVTSLNCLYFAFVRRDAVKIWTHRCFLCIGVPKAQG